MILITGGAGYIGSHVNKMLVLLGYETIIFDNISTGNIEAVKWGKLVVGELSDIKALEDVFKKNEISTVIHLAASAYVGESIIYPAKYYNNNVVNTINLLECMRKYHIKNLIFSSSCAVYGNSNNAMVSEDSCQNPINPYGASKKMIERIISDYGKAYGLKYCCLRYFNVAGGDIEGEIGESHSPETHIIPLVLETAVKKRKSFSIFGTDYNTNDGTCVRDYVHVSDIALAHIKAVEYLLNNGVSDFFNLANGVGYSVKEIIDVATRITNQDISLNLMERRLGDSAILIGDSSKAKKILQWVPQYPNIEVMIKHAWYWICNKMF